MPQLVKGGKWVFGWVVVRPERKIAIPPQAWQEYGFQAGDEALFLRGSRRSGGFGVSTPARLNATFGPLKDRLLGRGRFDQSGELVLPPEIQVEPGEQLLTVRGSRYALGFIAQGPICEEASRHTELECF